MEKNMEEGAASGTDEQQPLLLQRTTYYARYYAQQLLNLPTDTAGLLGRRMAHFLSNTFTGYGQDVSIDEGWSYFENVTLPRRMSDGQGGYVKAPPGIKDVPTTLYPAWTTPQRALNDFGTGIAGYFGTLRALIFICLVAGLIYTPTFRYYGSEKYAMDGQDALTGTLRGSLICTQTKWVPCPNCTIGEWDQSLDRIAASKDNHDLVFILKNDCAPLRWQEGVNHILVLFFLIGAMIGLALYQSRMEKEYDEDVLTASDFSIKIDNPPPDATDPQEWKDFFSEFEGCQVVYCTAALNNEELVKALVRRRVLMQSVEKKVREPDDESSDAREISQREALAATSRLTTRKLEKNEAKCRDLLRRRHATSAVFVTFDTEWAQREVLKILIVGKVNVAANNTSILPKRYLFRGNLVLDVSESVEPSAIRWQDLDETLAMKVMQRAFSSFLTVLIVMGGFFLVKRAFEHNVNVAAFSIVLLNILVPLLFKQMNRLEAHPNEGGYQASLYVKMCAFRWINTAIVTTLVKPFTSTVSAGADGLIPAIHAVLKAEIVTAPILHMLDIVGQIKRHVLARRSLNQGAVLMYFRGSVQNLGDKYTSVTKVIFLCFFYSVVFPASFFYGAIALAVTYVTDKFLLLRSWGPLPELGDDVAKLSRRVFFPLAILALAVMSEFYWSAYPFDNACEAEATVGSESYPEYIGTHEIVPVSSSSSSRDEIQLTISGDGTEQVWNYCDQDFLNRASDLLSFFRYDDKDDWMSADQQVLTFVFGISVVLVVVFIVVFNCIRSWIPSLREAFSGEFSTDELDSGKKFSSLERISAYVVQVRHAKFSYPLLACDVRGINPKHIGWSDPVRNFDYYNMALDVQQLLDTGEGEARSEAPVLSRIQYWPPPKQHGELRQQDDADKKDGVENYGSVKESTWSEGQ